MKHTKLHALRKLKLYGRRKTEPVLQHLISGHVHLAEINLERQIASAERRRTLRINPQRAPINPTPSSSASG